MKPEDLKYFLALTPDRIGGETCFLEAANQGAPGRVAQCWTVRMRVEHPSFQGHDVETVCYHQDAFSCYLSLNNPEYPEALAIAKTFDLYADPTKRIAGWTDDKGKLHPWTPVDAAALAECWQTFKDVMSGKIPNPFKSNDVFMYYRKGSAKPSWANKLAPADPPQIADHLFFRGR